MRKFLSTAVAAVVFATGSIAPIAPAFSQSLGQSAQGAEFQLAQRETRRDTPRRGYSKGDRERYVSRYCQRNPRDRDCRSDRRGWDEGRYNRWYRERHRDNNDAAAALFGLAAGAIIGGALNAAGNSPNGHVQACAARYRSYDARTDTYMGYDGLRHRCNL